MSEATWVPDRPHIPATLYLLCACFASAQLVLTWAPARSLLVASALAGGALLVLALGRGRTRDVGWGLACTLAGAALAASLTGMGASGLAASIDGTAALLSRRAASRLEFEVTSDPSLGERGYRCRARVLDGDARLGDVWLSSEERHELGSVLRVVGRFSPNEGEYGLSSRRQGVCGTVRVRRVLASREAGGLRGLVKGMRACVLGRIEPDSSDARAILAGSVCGNCDAMRRRGLDALFSACGVSHLVAVSGGHMAIVSSVVGEALARTRLSGRLRAVLLLALTALFVVFCGAPVSAVRSWLMCAVAFGSGLAGRRGHALSAVCVVALGMVALDPGVTGQLGFTLSVLSVVGLCVLSPYASYVLRTLAPGPRLPRSVPARLRSTVSGTVGSARDVLAATLVAQLVTTPLTCSTFGELSLVSPASNVVLAPLFSAIVGCGMGFACLCAVPVAPMLGAIALAPCDWAGELSVRALGVLSRLPYASLHVGCDLAVASVASLSAIVAVLVAWPRVRRGPWLGTLGALVLALCLTFARWRLLAPARVCVLDVGQGDSILVQDGSGAVLVDAGPDGSAAEELLRLHVMHLDAVVITHQHDDHYGGVAELAEGVPCDRVVVARGVRGSLAPEVEEGIRALVGDRVEEVALGDRIRVGGFELEVVWPEVPVEGCENADSVELLVTYDHGGRSLSALLTGDAERDETGEVVADGRVGDVDLLKVGHHGSKVSLSERTARELDPEVSVASAGEGNSYGHPSAECVDVLEDAGSRFLCTKDVGTVTVEPGRDGVIVSTELEPKDGG